MTRMRTVCSIHNRAPTVTAKMGTLGLGSSAERKWKECVGGSGVTSTQSVTEVGWARNRIVGVLLDMKAMEGDALESVSFIKKH